MFWRSLRKRILGFNGLERRSKIMAAGACLAVAVLLAWGSSALAAPGDELSFVNIGGPLGSLFLIILTGIVLLFLNLLMVVDLLLTKLLIAIAAYNNFVGAAAVTTGWPLVRDVANMFFIVVLLIIAFSTIIGYKEMDYKKYVPRLLLMAVLINFSKTLVGLLIDFSQVIMLTFVNGFKEAAFGNFVKMFGLQNVLSIAKDNTVEAIAKTSNLFIAAIFGVIMLSVVGTILLIMLIYFLARVIALWILLIFSPMAFFVWALPPKLQKSLSAFSTQWWQGLGSWLSGGPIVAFFLWLTMAIVAANDSPFSDIMPNDSETSFLQAAVTKAANPADIARFIVAVALLMMGLKQAVEVSKQASTALGKAAEKIKSSGGPIGYTGRMGARAAGKVGAAGVKFADQKFGISQKAGSFMKEQGLKMGKGGGLGGALGNVMVQQGGRVAAISGARAAATEKEHGETLKNMTPQERQSYNEMQAKSMNSDAASAARKAMLKDRFQPDFKDAAITSYEQQFKAMGMTDEKDRKAAAAQRYQTETARMMEEQGKDKDLMADSDHKKFIKDKLKEDPTLQVNIDKLESEIKDKKPGEISSQTMQSLDAVAALLKSQDLIKNGKLDPKIRESKFYENMQKQGGNKFKQLEAGISYMQRNPGSVDPVDASGKKVSRNVQMVAQNDGSVAVSRFDPASGAFHPESMGKAANVENLLMQAGYAGRGANPAAQQADLSASAQRFSGVSNTSQAAAVSNALNSGAYSGSVGPAVAGVEMANVQKVGVPTAQAFGIQADGSYENANFQAAHAAATSDAVSSGDIQFLTTIDPQIFSTGGQAAITVATALKGNLETISAAAAGDQVLTAKLQKIVKSISDSSGEAATRISAGVAEAADTALEDLRAELNNPANKNLRKMTKQK